MSVFRYERHVQPLAPPKVFVRRILSNVVIALAVVAVSLAAGMAGYHFTEGLDWLDSFLNAAMLLGGMGPVAQLHTDAGKIFAGSYALFCGLVVIFTAGVILAPILHRVVHALHAAEN